MGDKGSRVPENYPGGGGNQPPGNGGQGTGGGGPNWDTETFVSQMRAAAGELSIPGRSEEIMAVLRNSEAAQRALSDGYLVDAAQTSFAGDVIILRGTERINSGAGGMGLDHIINRHGEDFMKTIYGNEHKFHMYPSSLAQETFDITMNIVRSGEVMERFASKRGSGYTYIVNSSWKGRDFSAKVTINAGGELVQANPL